MNDETAAADSARSATIACQLSYSVGDNEISSSPAVDDDGEVYVGSNWDSTVSAVNAASSAVEI